MMPESENYAEAKMLAKELLKRNSLQEKIIRDFEADIIEFSEERIEKDLMEALKDPTATDFDVGVMLAAEILRDGQRLPRFLAKFAADVLEGKQKRPTKRGPDPDKHYLRDYQLAFTVLQLSRKFDLPQYTNNELSTKLTAAEIVAEASGCTLEVVRKATIKFGWRIKSHH